ncbi:putative gustatory receptor 98d [Drosophila ficusphila]|uniref:putative gustatory receptor 98d n=1 Tax=Drosophila ficusphila TaxID=30025 RepID=UPI0007E72D63|nr:putative gustatory receptor 98d [Drosophila ficusphila]
MEVNRSRLLTSARPYLQVLSVFGLTPPPLIFDRTLSSKLKCYLITGYACFSFVIILIVIYECYANIGALQLHIKQFHAEDFSKVMGKIQKILVVVMAMGNQLNMLLNFRRLKIIYEDIADLELDIEEVSAGFTEKRKWLSFRYRLAICIGLWMVLLVDLAPRLIVVGLAPFLTSTNRFLTEIILLMLQLKSLEYCIFVFLIYEMILRVRHILLQILSEVKACNCNTRIQELCVTLKQNQLLVGRIWKLVGEIGIYFTLSMTLLFLYNGLTILHFVNWSIIKSINPKDCCQYGRIGASLLLSTNIFLACFYSERCVRAYNSINHILQEIGCLSASQEFSILKMGLREYCLQMEHLKLIFTCELFDINLKCFGGMVVTIFGYMIILVQFKIQVFADLKYSQNLSEIIE